MKKMIITIICLTVSMTLAACGQSSETRALKSEIRNLEDEIFELEETVEELENENANLKKKLKKETNGDGTVSATTEDTLELIVETRGVCGAELNWEYGNGILRIYGTGEMSDYSDYRKNRPWEEICDKINHVYIEEGCTYVGEDAFAKIYGLSKVVLPNSVEKVGSSVLYDCKNVKKIIWGKEEYDVDGDDLLKIEDEICDDGREAECMWGLLGLASAPAATEPATEVDVYVEEAEEVAAEVAYEEEAYECE